MVRVFGDYEMKILVHVGANKTGSSLIQEHILPNISNYLYEHGIIYSNEIGHIIGEHVQRPYPKLPMQDGKIDMYRRNIEYQVSKIVRDKPNTKCIIISREKYFGHPRSSVGFYNNEIIAQNIKGILQDYNTSIIGFVRRQDTFIESNYGSAVKQGETKTFKEFLKSIDVQSYKWHNFADNYARLFGIARL